MVPGRGEMEQAERTASALKNGGSSTSNRSFRFLHLPGQKKPAFRAIARSGGLGIMSPVHSHGNSATLWLVIGALLIAARTANAEYSVVSYRELPQQACMNNVSEHLGFGSKFILNGTRAALYPQRQDGTYDESNVFIFQLSTLIENRRNFTYPDNSCDSGNEVLQTMSLTDCNCVRTPYLRETANYKDEGYAFTLTECTGQPGFTLTAFLSVTDQEYTETFGPTMSGSNFDTFEYNHPAGGMKIGINISNWNWAPEGIDNETFISFGFLFAAKTSLASTVYQNITTKSTVFKMVMPPYSLELNLERGIFLDGEPSISGNAHPGLHPIPFFPFSSLWLGLHDSIGFCAPSSTIFKKWRHIDYDPSFVSLFSPDFTSPLTTPANAKSRAWVVPVAVSVSVVVALLVAGVVLAAIFIPAVRNFFRPYSAPRKTAGMLTQTDSKSRTTDGGGDWKKASKPSNP